MHSGTKKWRSFKRKNVKITKAEHTFKGFASTYNIESLNYFNPELQIKDTEYAIKNKLKKLLSQLRDINSWQN